MGCARGRAARLWLPDTSPARTTDGLEGRFGTRGPAWRGDPSAGPLTGDVEAVAFAVMES